jgi:hypothetical protein
MAKRPSVEDARLILELYDLKREPEMRKARQWWLTTFWPSNADDYVKVAMSFGVGREQLAEASAELLGDSDLFCGEWRA